MCAFCLCGSAGLSIILAFGLLLLVAGLRSELKRFVDQKGVCRDEQWHPASGRSCRENRVSSRRDPVRAALLLPTKQIQCVTH